MLALLSKSIYISGLLLIVVYYGGVYLVPSAIGLIAILIACALALARNGVYPQTKIMFWQSFATYNVLALFSIVQSIPLPVSIQANSLWLSAYKLGVIEEPLISIAPGDTNIALVSLSISFMAFFGGLQVFSKEKDIENTFRIASYILSFLVIFGIIQHIAFPTILLFFEKTNYIGSLTGIFVNRNTAGTFLGLVTYIFVVRVCQLAPMAGLGYNLQRFANGIPIKVGRIHLELLAAIVLFILSVISLFLTQSRGAIASFCISFALFLILVSFYPIDVLGNSATKRRSHVIVRVFRLTIALGISLGALVMFGGRTILRAQVQGTEDGRFCVMPGILEMANDRWLTGWGFGTFRTAFAPYRDPLCGVNGTWVRAHNAYLEAYAGLGIIFWPILAVAVGTLVAVYVRGIRRRRSMRIYAHVGLSGLIMTLLHSAIDFSIQIPGYAAAFAFFCALTITASAGKRRKESAALSN